MLRRPTLPLAACLLSLLTLPVSAQQLATKPALTLEAAKTIAAAAEAHARQNSWNVCITIVDDGGHLLYFQRMDGTQTGSVQVSMKKAESAIAFKRPTKVFEQQVVDGRTALVALPGGMPFEGGLPLVSGDHYLGAIGVSGVTAQQDGMIAQAGVDALAKMTTAAAAPAGGTQGPGVRSLVLRLHRPADGKTPAGAPLVTLGSRRLSLDRVEPYLAAEGRRFSELLKSDDLRDVMVVIEAEESLEYKYVWELIQHCEAAGFEKITIQTAA